MDGSTSNGSMNLCRTTPNRDEVAYREYLENEVLCQTKKHRDSKQKHRKFSLNNVQLAAINNQRSDFGGPWDPQSPRMENL